MEKYGPGRGECVHVAAALHRGCRSTSDNSTRFVVINLGGQPALDYRSFRYNRIVIGAKMAVMAAGEMSASVTAARFGSPSMRPRTAVTRCVIGFSATTDCNQSGIVTGSTKIFDAKVSGIERKSV